MQCSNLGSLLNHLVGETKQSGWHFNTDQLGDFGMVAEVAIAPWWRRRCV